MEKKKIEGASFADTGYSYTLSLISGKYKPVILYCLMEYEPVRLMRCSDILAGLRIKP